jgi:hypothetical protein
MISDYCYSDRLRCLILDLILQPLAFRYCLLQHNLPAFLSSVFKADFRDEVSFRLRCVYPEGFRISLRLPVAEALRILSPCDSIAERTFPVFVDLLNIAGRGVLLVQASALLLRRPEGLTEADCASLK